MRVGIVGSRRRCDRESVEELVASLPAHAIVVSGGCRGVDKWAATAGRRRGLQVVEHLIPPAPGGRTYYEFTRAAYARNRKIAEDVDVLYAFVAPDRRGGTENTIGHAERAGVTVRVR